MILGKLALIVTPKIVFSVKDTDFLSRKIRPRLFDILEFRADLFPSDDLNSNLSMIHDPLSIAHYPTIFTVRSKQEGGGWNRSELKRFALFQKMIPHVSAVDIELSAKTILTDVIDSAHDQKKKVIVSYHDFDKTPSAKELEKVLKSAKAVDADIVKVATFAKDYRDIQRLARFTVANASQNIVTIAMGEIGALSRLFFPALGSLLTYASFGGKIAPGQIDCKELSRLIKRFYPKGRHGLHRE